MLETRPGRDQVFGAQAAGWPRLAAKLVGQPEAQSCAIGAGPSGGRVGRTSVCRVSCTGAALRGRRGEPLRRCQEPEQRGQRAAAAARRRRARRGAFQGAARAVLGLDPRAQPAATDVPRLAAGLRRRVRHHVDGAILRGRDLGTATTAGSGLLYAPRRTAQKPPGSLTNAAAPLGEAAARRRQYVHTFNTRWDDQGRWNHYALAFPSRVLAPSLPRSRLLTLSRVDLDQFRLDRDGRVLNCLGEPFAVVHQLARCRGRVGVARNCLRLRDLNSSLVRRATWGGVNKYLPPMEACARVG